MHSRLCPLTLFLLISFTSSVLGACECGYLVSHPQGLPSSLYTTTIFTNFTDSGLNDIGSDWIKSNYPIESSPYTQYYYSSNVYRSEGGNGLNIRAQAYGGSGPVRGGEMRTQHTNILYGSFRASLQTSTTPGACQAMFFYKNDNQEIDIELLTSKPSKVFFTNQPSSQGSTATPTIKYNASSLYHEYRIDWASGKTQFFIDGESLATLTKNVPTTPGEIILNSWSNGDPSWSAGPPKQDAILKVHWVQLFFNTTNKDRIQEFEAKCSRTFNPMTAVCRI